jgi:hypothetical protein
MEGVWRQQIRQCYSCVFVNFCPTFRKRAQTGTLTSTGTRSDLKTFPLNHRTDKGRPLSVTTDCHKSRNGVCGKQSSSPGSRDGTLIRLSGIGKTRVTVTSTSKTSSKISSEASPNPVVFPLYIFVVSIQFVFFELVKQCIRGV